MERTLTCIVCPLGCQLKVTLEGKTVKEVTGNTCPRGQTYAETECTAPMRTVTSIVRCSDGGLVAVKTANPIPKEAMARCMERINTLVAQVPVYIGDVLLEDVCGSPLVATQNRE